MERFYKNTKEQLVDSINTLNTLPIPLTVDTVLLGDATPVGNDGLVEVGVRGIFDRGYRKSTTKVTYTRLDLGRLFSGIVNPSITTLSQSSLHRLLHRVNALLGLRLTVSDVSDIDFTPHGQDITVGVTITASPTSTYYSGSFTLTFNRRWLLLNEVVKPTILAFNHPDPILKDHVSVGLLTWGKDFTNIRPLLAVNPQAADYRGDWTNYAAFRDGLLEHYNILSWPSNAVSSRLESTVKDYATHEVERSNLDFQRVVVQTGIREREYVGTAYFHYNLP